VGIEWHLWSLQTLLRYQANPEFNRYLLFVLVSMPQEGGYFLLHSAFAIFPYPLASRVPAK
jgi:hypothetical protein